MATKNKVRFGLRNLRYALKTAEGYAAPVALPGAVTLTLDPQGEKATFFADDGPFHIVVSNNGFTGDLETALFDDDFMVAVLGFIRDTAGVLVELADGKQVEFALLGEIQGDKQARRFAYPSVIAERPKNEYKTNEEGIEVKTETMPITVSPVDIGGQKVVRYAVENTEATKTVYDGWFTSVYEPTWAAA